MGNAEPAGALRDTAWELLTVLEERVGGLGWKVPY